MKLVIISSIIILMFTFLALNSYSQDNTAWELSWQLLSEEIPTFVRGWELKSGSDIDKDGWGEFLAESSVTGTFMLFEADGDNSYFPIWSFNVPGHVNTGARQAEITDWDLDGIEEVTLIGDAPPGTDALYVFEGDGTDNGIPAEPTVTWDPQRNNSDRIALEAVGMYAQLDSDPGKEMILPFFEGGDAVLEIIELANADLENPQWKVEYFEGGSGRTWGVAVGDLDLDGNMEIVTADAQNKRLSVVENIDEDQYQVETRWSAEQIDPKFSPARASLAIANFGGGYPELFVLSLSGHVFVLENEGDLSAVNSDNFYVLRKFGGWGSAELRGISIGDQDRDGNPDIYFGNTKDGTVYDLEFDGGDPADSSNYTLYPISNEIGWCGNVKIGNELGDVYDLDKDDMQEIVVITGDVDYTSQPILNIFENQSAGTFVATHNEKIVPKANSLLQNYPNPFNASTQIRYQIPSSGQVSLTVYNSVGQPVRQLVNEYQSAGLYRATWDGKDVHGRDVSSGLWIYRLETEGFVDSGKMILLR